MEKRHLRDYDKKSWGLEPVHYIIFGLTAYVLAAILTSCSPNSGVLKSKCYDPKWHSYEQDTNKGITECYTFED